MVSDCTMSLLMAYMYYRAIGYKRILTEAKSNKFLFRQHSIKYFGQVFSANGMEPYMERARAIQDMQPPANVSELRKTVGIVQFLKRFLSKLSSTIFPLTKLLSRDASWIWEQPSAKGLWRHNETGYGSTNSDGLWSLQNHASYSRCVFIRNGWSFMSAWWFWNLWVKVAAYCSRSLTAADRN